MEKVVISVLGADRPGIVAAVSRVLFEHGCNIEDVSQTALQSEFSGIFIATTPPDLTRSALRQSLEEVLEPQGLLVILKPLHSKEQRYAEPPSEPFVITTMGPDRLGLVAGITEVLARFRINITNLRAIFRGGDHPHHNIMIYQVDIPNDIDHAGFRSAVRRRAEELDLDLSIQHHAIFEAINRI